MMMPRTTTKWQFGWFLGWLATCCLAAGRVAADLPGETEWPGDRTPHRQLPDETSWPGEPAPTPVDPDSLVTETTPPAVDRDSESVASPPSDNPDRPLEVERRLPTESTWPIAMGLAGEELPGAKPPENDGPDNNLLTEARDKSVDERPWLRLQTEGPIAPIRALTFTSDGRRLIAAGEDKHTLVWHRDPAAAVPDWHYERTIRWQIQRGPLGHVFALGPHSEHLAMAGHGAMGGHAEIWVVDPTTGAWQTTLVEPDDNGETRQVITALHFASHRPNPILVAADREGEVVSWTRGEKQWERKRLVPTDAEQYGTEIARRLEPLRGFSPAAVIGSFAVAPQWTSFVGRGIPVWRLVRVPLDGRTKPVPLTSNGPDHVGFVSNLAVSHEAGLLVSADGVGNLFIWRLRGTPQWKRFSLDALAISLALTPDGQRLVIGLAPRKESDKSGWQVWDLADPLSPRTLIGQETAEPVRAAAITSDGRSIALATGNRIEVRDTSGERPTQSLQGTIQTPQQIAFSDTEPLQLRLTSQIAPGQPLRQQVFDTKKLQLTELPGNATTTWSSPNAARGDWRLQRDPEQAHIYWFVRHPHEVTDPNHRHGRIVLQPQYHGERTAICWIPDDQQRPFAVAVATNGHNNIYIHRISEAGDAPLLRQFRGHAAEVTSLAVSPDRTYLGSTSRDGTTRVWNLAGFDANEPDYHRWGAEFAVAGNRLTVTAISRDGPLYFRGMRRGDTIERLELIDGSTAGRVRTVDSPHEMERVLARSQWNTPLTWTYRRGPDYRKSFQSLPAWQPLVSLAIDQQGEWAYWHPAGYYDASFEGHRLFGWQFNRGLYLTPDFFLAAQLRTALERPAVMSRLLEAGSLAEAFDLAHHDVPANPHEMIATVNRLRPRVDLLRPSADDVIEGNRVVIEAHILVPQGEDLVPPKAFANGVVAPKQTLVDEQTVREGDQEFIRRHYRWHASLPSDQRVMIQVVAATADELADTAEVQLNRRAIPATRTPRLYLVAAGVNDYLDRRVQSLDFAVNNALRVREVFASQSGGLYESHATALLNNNVTRPMWRVTLSEYADQLRDTAIADDLLVLFLSGHGVRDPEDENYYYLTAESQLSDVLARRYGDCLSFEDLAHLAEIPCRKLVILDTCHSGAVSSSGQQQLKAAIRSLQDDMIMTWTASRGSEEAAESRNHGMGRFTYHLVEALRGAGDTNHDGTVSLDEASDYVRGAVMIESTGDPVPQVPTTGPARLFRVSHIPLTHASGS